MDSYQATYDAVRSRINPVNSHDVLESAARNAFDISHARQMLQGYIESVGWEMTRPSMLWRPALKRDGDQWCALYGENLQEGVSGFGPTPDMAMSAFDKAWHEHLSPPKSADEIMSGFDSAIDAIKTA